MDILDAVKLVLSEYSEPQRITLVAEEIVKRKLWTSSGKTPEATIGARVYMDIKKKGVASQFKKCGKGLIMLNTGSIELALKETKQQIVPIKKDSAKIGFSFCACAEKVLELSKGRKPMHYQQITQQAIANGWLVSSGKTPEASMYAQILTENKKDKMRGRTPRFTLLGKGMVGLYAWQKNNLMSQIEQNNNNVARKLLARLHKLQPGEFEELVQRLLETIGFENTKVTKLSGDGGIDVRGIMVTGDVIQTRMAVQVKRWKANVQAPIVQQLRGSLKIHEQGLIVTTSDFSKGAVDEANRVDATPIALMNGKQLVKLLMDNEIMVKRESCSIFEIDQGEE